MLGAPPAIGNWLPLRGLRCVLVRGAVLRIRAVPAPRPAAIATLQVVCGSKNHQRTLEIIVLGIETGRVLRARASGDVVHVLIVSQAVQEPFVTPWCLKQMKSQFQSL